MNEIVRSFLSSSYVEKRLTFGAEGTGFDNCYFLFFTLFYKALECQGGIWYWLSLGQFKEDIMLRYFKNVRCFGGGALRDDTKNGYVAD